MREWLIKGFPLEKEKTSEGARVFVGCLTLTDIIFGFDSSRLSYSAHPSSFPKGWVAWKVSPSTLMPHTTSNRILL